MKQDRLEQLYRRRLVLDQSAARKFPEQFTLNKEVSYFPEKPVDLNFDILEIGPGRGDFLYHLAGEHPDRRLMAIEIGKLRFARLAERIQKRGLTNVTLVGADARIPFARDLQGARFGKIYVLFPDPWPRNRHRHKRLLTREFLTLLCDKLAPGGEFTLATDVEDYARWVLASLEQIPGMTNIQGQDLTRTPLPDLIPTFFETKWKDMGRICNYVRFKKP